MGSTQADIAIYGLGGIGSFYAFILRKCKNVRLTVIARSNYEAVKTNGLRFSSRVHGQHTVHFDEVLDSPSKAGRTFDYVICAHKAIDDDNSAGKLASIIDPPRTTVVLIQNGLGIEEPFRKAYPQATIVSCVTWTGAKQVELGVVEQLELWERLQYNLYPGAGCDTARDGQRLQFLSALLDEGGTKHEIVPDIQQIRWKKIVSNTSWNSVTALTKLKTHEWLESSDYSTPLTKKLMTEVVTIAKASGVDLDVNTPDIIINEMLQNVSVGSSMLNDLRAGKEMEVEVILGKPLKKAKELGVDSPILETLYTLMAAINEEIRQR